MSLEYKHGAVSIIGGTGTLGYAISSYYAAHRPDITVTIFSRDEHKQSRMKSLFPNFKYIIGDIRNPNSLQRAVAGRDIVFHVAALKHVDVCEANPEECDLTNLTGTLNVAKACLVNHVKRVVFSSTDKAVDPINHYGRAKASAERYLYSYNKEQSHTKFSIYRWGNVIGSQGSALFGFMDSLVREKKVYLTDPEMTRFWIPIEWAVRFMMGTITNASTDKAMIPSTMKAASVLEIVDVLAELLGITAYDRIVTGLRPGEKIHEAIYGQWSGEFLASNTQERYSRDELIELLSPYVEVYK